MPHYFFDLLNGLGLVPDEEGAELPNLHAARQRAISEARPIMANEVLEGRLDLSGRIIVRSETGEVLFEVPFSEALVIEHPSQTSGEA